MCVYKCKYVRPYVHTYVRICACTYVRMCVLVCSGSTKSLAES